MTEVVRDNDNFRSLLWLFMCSKLGPVTVSMANLGQRRILNKIVSTLTQGKANFLVCDDFGRLMLQSLKHLPTYL